MITLYFTSLALLIYIYFGYGALTLLLAKIFRKHVSPKSLPDDALPKVSILIAAYNEANYIEATVKNKLEQNYPKDKLEVIVVSDHSDDNTDAIVRNLQATTFNLTLIRQTTRQGKSAALNVAVDAAQGEILVFSDANSIYAKDAVRSMVSYFTSPEVGYVTGQLQYLSKDDNSKQITEQGSSQYIQYENFIRRQESAIHSIIGVNGGIDAMRRDLFQPMRADQLPDLIQPINVIQANYRVIYAKEAISSEYSHEHINNEFRMRVRVSLRTLWLLNEKKYLLNPIKYPWLTLQIISHKILRYAAGIPLIVLFLTNALLVLHSPFFLGSLLAQTIFYSIAMYGFLSKKQPRGILMVPTYFCLLNAASLLAIIYFALGKKITLWQPRN